MKFSHSEDSEELTGKDIGIAFLACFGTAMAIMTGVSSIWFIKKMRKSLLAAAMSFAAGVMMYVTLAEMLPESAEMFEHHGLKHEHAYAYGSLSLLADFLVHHFLGGHDHDHGHGHDHGHDHGHAHVHAPHSISRHSSHYVSEHLSDRESIDPQLHIEKSRGGGDTEKGDGGRDTEKGDGGRDTEKGDGGGDEEQPILDEETKALKRVGVYSTLAIAFHNIPEGMATFASAAQSPTFGVIVAIAIGLHNLPEGLAIAYPMYFATKSRWKAFWWSSIAAVSVMIGGCVSLGLISLSKASNHLMNGIVFGLTGGMMIHISLAEMYPQSIVYATKRPHLPAICLFAGMFVMGLSLVLFELTGQHQH
eukprot:GHVL01014586.1.p1 GENE.GHVL01014586.1~~GHVL01014586.1.p1  ORF type:complete len:363 (-),score=50.40 GHVL01014586.1:386-1474(-)